MHSCIQQISFQTFLFCRMFFRNRRGKVGAEPQNNKEEGNWTKWFMQRIRLEFKRILFIFFESCNESSDLSIFTNFWKISCFSFIIKVFWSGLLRSRRKCHFIALKVTKYTIYGWDIAGHYYRSRTTGIFVTLLPRKSAWIWKQCYWGTSFCYVEKQAMPAVEVVKQCLKISQKSLITKFIWNVSEIQIENYHNFVVLRHFRGIFKHCVNQPNFVPSH